MARRRSTTEQDPAPGDEPGAASFARPGARRSLEPEPTGIVRLSDLVAPPARAADGDDAARPSRGLDAAFPRGDRQERSFRGASRRASAIVGDGARTVSPPAGDGHARASSLEPPEAARVPAADGPHPEPPPYESLFDGAGDATRRRRRERPPASALQRALGLLTRREHSRKELTRKLVSRGVDAAEVEAAVEKLASAGWQDERRFAENLVRARASAGYGPLHIRAELATHDLPAELRQAALDGFEGDWSEIAADIVRRRFSRIEDPRQRERKAVDFLMRRGFPADVARAAGRAMPDGD